MRAQRVVPLESYPNAPPDRTCPQRQCCPYPPTAQRLSITAQDRKAHPRLALAEHRGTCTAARPAGKKSAARGSRQRNVIARSLAVIWRKLSFGMQSAAGSQFVETILAVTETYRRQSLSNFGLLTATLEAHFVGQPAPLPVGQGVN